MYVISGRLFIVFINPSITDKKSDIAWQQAVKLGLFVCSFPNSVRSEAI